ncbi:c-type cytochrome [Bosea thiooxidans]
MTIQAFNVHGIRCLIACVLAGFQPLSCFAADVGLGKAEYASKCASCHGQGGAGDGVVAPALRVEPPDLRLLTRKNGGVFPERVLKDVIDGRRSLRVHGNYEMPVWGNDLSSSKSKEDNSVRIDNIVEYLKAIQVE